MPVGGFCSPVAQTWCNVCKPLGVICACCVFRFNVTGDSGIVTAVPANVTRGVPAT
jgi:hypothetical protein